MLDALATRVPRLSLPRLRARRSRARALDRVSVPREVLRFVAGGLLAALMIVGGSFWAVSAAATAEAVNSAQLVARLDAHGIVQPMLTTSLLAGDPTAIANLDRVVHQRVLDGRVVRVKIWSTAGTIVYSDEHRLIGSTFALGDDEEQALTTGVPHAEVSDLTRPENQLERRFGSLVEVYLPVGAADGSKLLFETYQTDTAIQADKQRVWGGVLPALIAGTGLLFVVMVPLSWRLASRLERSGRERAGLLQRAIDSSDTERRRIAGDLHDGPVQNLTAVSLTLGAVAGRLATPTARQPERAELLDVVTTATDEARSAIRELRSLIVEIAPPDLRNGGMTLALERLLNTAREAGLAATLSAPSHIELTPEMTGLVYRAAQECVRNVIKHAHATTLAVIVTSTATSTMLDVADDGCGFSVGDLEQRSKDGHIGLSLLRDRAVEAGATLTFETSPGHGTRVRVAVRNA